MRSKYRTQFSKLQFVLLFSVIGISAFAAVPQNAFANPSQVSISTLDLDNDSAADILLDFADGDITVIDSETGWTIGQADAGGTPVSLNGQTFGIAGGDVTIQIDEATRIAIIADLGGEDARIIVPASSVTDTTINSAILTSAGFTPDFDDVLPTLDDGTPDLDLGAGTLSFDFDETIDVSTIDLTNITIEDAKDETKFSLKIKLNGRRHVLEYQIK